METYIMVNMMERNLLCNKLLESRMIPKGSCPVWRGVVEKVFLLNSRNNSLAAYSTSRTVLRGTKAAMPWSTHHSNSVYDLLASKGIRTIIPPLARTKALNDKPRTLRDHSSNYIQNKGIHAWYTKNNYRRREKVENTFYRYKTIIGRKLMSRKWENQDAEIHLGCVILNQMTKLGMPNSVKTS